MAAVIDPHTGSHLPDAPPRRPSLTLVQGGRADRPGRPAPASTARSTAHAPVARRTYLVRRAAVLVAVAVVVVVLAQAFGALAGTVAEAVDGPPAASGQVHVVRSGETAWSLAGRLAPQLDRRTAVDDLLALNGDAPLRVGQQLRLPASFD